MDPRGASKICRKSLWSLAVQIAGIAGVPVMLEMLRQSTYKEVKDSPQLADRRRVKKSVQNQGLGGWVHNNGDSSFALASSSPPAS